jgi:anti-sigma regulatory factor (Ser/Thr protein kinase)
MLTSRRFPRAIPEVPRARHFVIDLFAEQRAEATDAILLVTSELVTNAVRNGSGQVELRVDLDDGAVRVEVLDEGHAALPVPQGPPPPDAIGGRGLHLVGAVSDAWGSGFDEEGRTLVWAELTAPQLEGSSRSMVPMA